MVVGDPFKTFFYPPAVLNAPESFSIPPALLPFPLSYIVYVSLCVQLLRLESNLNLNRTDQVCLVIVQYDAPY